MDPPVDWPLQLLPPALAEALVAHLPRETKQSLRLTCKAAQALVDAGVRWLFITAAGPFKGGLAARFPRLAGLQLLSGVRDQQGGPWALDQARTFEASRHFAAFMSGPPWHSIQTLTIIEMCAGAAATVIRSCPNVDRCEFRDLLLDDSTYDMAGVLGVACSSLPRLGSLTLSGKIGNLGDAELLALRGCVSLVHLDATLGQISTAGWESLLALPITSLELHLQPGELPKARCLAGRPA